MGRYRKIETRIWCDETFRSLSDDAKVVFILLLTHPDQTSIGAFRATPNSLAVLLKWSGKRFAKPYTELLRRGRLRYDESGVMWLPNFLRYNAPENGNVVKSWVPIISAIPECELLKDILLSMKPFAERFGIPLPIPFAKPQRNGMPNTEPEPEPEPEPKEDPLKPPRGHECEIPANLDTDEFHAAWSDWMAHRKENRWKTGATCIKNALAHLSDLGQTRSVAAIRHSIANGWQGIFEPKAGVSTNGRHAPGPGQRHAADLAAGDIEGTF